MENFLGQIIPLLLTAILGVLAVVIKSLGDVAIKFMIAKKEEVIARLGEVEYHKRLSTAHDIWGVVDEHFRIYDSVAYEISDKVGLFNKLLLERIPTLDQSDLDYLRQTIAGQINQGKDALYPKED